LRGAQSDRNRVHLWRNRVETDLYRAETRVLAGPRSKRYVRQFARAIGVILTGQTG
jgi:hypothetical protein